MIDIIKVKEVLAKNYKNSIWTIPDDAISYSEVNWTGNDTKPTEVEIEEQYQEIVDNAYITQHVINRPGLYPTTDELVVALWEKLVETDGLTSDSIIALQDARILVKQKCPKLTSKNPPKPVVEFIDGEDSFT